MISRRTFLRGAGVAVGLPLLDAMAPSIAKAQNNGGGAPKRLLAFYVPNGINMADFTPAAEGASYRLTPILAGLSEVKEDVLIVSGLANLPARADVPGDHARGTGAFLTCAQPFRTEGADIHNGVSMDQVAANAIGGQTPFASLQLGTDGGGSTGNCDSGYSCAYARNISWAGPSTPLAKDTNPRSVFDRLFGGSTSGVDTEASRKIRKYKQSILDFVKEDATTLSRKLGRTDQHKVSEYLEGIRALELRLAQMDGREPGSCRADAPAVPNDLEARATAMIDLMVIAFQCDLTRVISFMLGNGGSNTSYGFLGVPEAHHELSHHQGNPDTLAKLTKIDAWEVKQLGSLLSKMKAVREPNGTLLDNSVVFFSSEIEDGNSHAHTNMPIIVAGRGGGAIRPGRHIRYGGQRPVADLFLSMLSAVGATTSNFGNSTGELSNMA